MDEEFLSYYAVAVLCLSLVFLAAAGIARRLIARSFLRMPPNTKRNALTYALLLVNRDEGILAEHLGIPIGELIDYLDGKQEVPIPVVRKAIRLVLEKTRADKATQGEVLRKIREFDRKA
jgi:hypothetical protein